jgi:segregation and condensation protein B
LESTNNPATNLNPELTENQTQVQQQDAQQNNVELPEKKQQSLVLLEAALYVAGRPLDINEICSVLNTRSKKKGEQIVEALKAEYASRNTAMEILRLKDERYVMQVKADFTPLVKKLVNRPLLSSGPLKTLSYIAYRQPITSKRVIEVRGQHAYGHVKTLKDMGLVATERSGRAIVLKTTDYFADYFGLTMDTTTMKRDLKRIFGEALKDEQQA